MVIATAVLLAAMTVIACGGTKEAADQRTGTRSVAQPGAPAFPPNEAKLAELRKLAYRTAAHMGVENPSDVRVFATTFGTANMAIRGVSSASPRIGEPVYLVMMRGGVFVSEDAPRPSGAPPPTGKMASLFVDPETEMVEAASLSDRVHDLSALGESISLE